MVGEGDNGEQVQAKHIHIHGNHNGSMCDPIYNCRYHQVDINRGRSLGIGYLFIIFLFLFIYFESRLLSWPGTHQSGQGCQANEHKGSISLYLRRTEITNSYHDD